MFLNDRDRFGDSSAVVYLHLVSHSFIQEYIEVI